MSKKVEKSKLKKNSVRRGLDFHTEIREEVEISKELIALLPIDNVTITFEEAEKEVFKLATFGKVLMLISSTLLGGGMGADILCTYFTPEVVKDNSLKELREKNPNFFKICDSFEGKLKIRYSNLTQLGKNNSDYIIFVSLSFHNSVIALFLCCYAEHSTAN